MVRKLMVVALLAGGLAAATGCRPTAAGVELKVAMPGRFPADVPLPEAAVIQTAQDLGARGLNLTFATRLEPAAAAAAYRERLQRAGWRLVAGAAEDDDVFMSFRKEGRSVAVGVSRAERGTGIGVAYAALP